jgi:hypothetical protein
MIVNRAGHLALSEKYRVFATSSPLSPLGNRGPLSPLSDGGRDPDSNSVLFKDNAVTKESKLASA